METPNEILFNVKVSLHALIQVMAWRRTGMFHTFFGHEW